MPNRTNIYRKSKHDILADFLMSPPKFKISNTALAKHAIELVHTLVLTIQKYYY